MMIIIIIVNNCPEAFSSPLRPRLALARLTAARSPPVGRPLDRETLSEGKRGTAGSQKLICVELSSRPWGFFNSCMYAFPEKNDGFAILWHMILCIWIWDLRPSIWSFLRIEIMRTDRSEGDLPRVLGVDGIRPPRRSLPRKGQRWEADRNFCYRS